MLIKFLNGTEREITDLYHADLRGADLYEVNLRWAYLREADLSGANLCDANLRGADLSRAILRDASLCGADLRGADLRGADLRGADLRGADLCRADLPKDFRIAQINFGGWAVVITPTRTVIGCQDHDNVFWLKADPRWIAALDTNATTWWTRHGATIQAAIRDVMA